MDYSPPGSSVHEILQARILEWVAMPSSRESSPPSDRTCIFCGPWITGRFFTAEWEENPKCGVLSLPVTKCKFTCPIQWGQTEKLVWGSEKGLLQGHSRRMGDLCPGNSELLEWFQENIFKGHVVGVEGWVEGVTGHVISPCTILWLDDGEVTGWCHSSYHYQSLGVGLGVMCSQSRS